MAVERKPDSDNLNFHCPVEEQKVDSLQDTHEYELKCPVECYFYGKTGDLCGKIRVEKANGGITRDTRYKISDVIAPRCLGTKKLGYPTQDRFTRKNNT